MSVENRNKNKERVAMSRVRSLFGNLNVWGPAVSVLLVTCLLVVFGAGCSDNPVSVQNDEVVTETISADADTGPNENFNAPPPRDFDVPTNKGIEIAGDVVPDAATISPVFGGSFPYNDNHFRFTVPPGAVRKPVTITARVDETVRDGKHVFVHEFGPDGLKFSVPAEISFNPELLGPDVTEVAIYYINPRSGDWELESVQTVTVDERTGEKAVELPVNHFSKYGISRW